MRGSPATAFAMSPLVVIPANPFLSGLHALYLPPLRYVAQAGPGLTALLDQANLELVVFLLPLPSECWNL